LCGTYHIRPVLEEQEHGKYVSLVIVDGRYKLNFGVLNFLPFSV
jgi:hypothetical protein